MTAAETDTVMGVGQIAASIATATETGAGLTGAQIAVRNGALIVAGTVGHGAMTVAIAGTTTAVRTAASSVSDGITLRIADTAIVA